VGAAVDDAAGLRLRDVARGALGPRPPVGAAAINGAGAGEGDIVPFPFRLELLLRKRYPGRMIDVVNRGIIGQEAPEEFARFGLRQIAFRLAKSSPSGKPSG